MMAKENKNEGIGNSVEIRSIWTNIQGQVLLARFLKKSELLTLKTDPPHSISIGFLFSLSCNNSTLYMLFYYDRGCHIC